MLRIMMLALGDAPALLFLPHHKVWLVHGIAH